MSREKYAHNVGDTLSGSRGDDRCVRPAQYDAVAQDSRTNVLSFSLPAACTYRTHPLPFRRRRTAMPGDTEDAHAALMRFGRA